jgi:hypothetical protein
VQIYAKGNVSPVAGQDAHTGDQAHKSGLVSQRNDTIELEIGIQSRMTYTNKTQPTTISPEQFLAEHYSHDERVSRDAQALLTIYSKATGSPAVMWNKIFGFGSYVYKDSKGGEHTHLMTGFALSKSGFTLYNILGWNAYQTDIKELGVYKLSGKSCLAIKRLDDIDQAALAKVIKKSVADMKQKYPCVV